VTAPLFDDRTLLDGGMGQELLRRGIDADGNALWSANALLDAPDTVQAVHEDYLRAGADVITTNTYATPRQRLAAEGLGDRFAPLNEQAGRLATAARDTVNPEALIAGSLPPLRGSYRPDRVGPVDALVPQYREMAEVLAPHVDFFLCETMTTAAEARAAATGAAATDHPVVVSWTLVDHPSEAEDGLLRDGTSLADAVGALDNLPVAAFLVNCAPPESVTAAVPRLSRHATVPVGGYANGFRAIPDDWEYDAPDVLPETRDDLAPGAYAGYVRQWIADGARIVGGCCEIGPDHIAYLREMMDEERVRTTG